MLDPKVLDNIREMDTDGSVLIEIFQMYMDELPQHVQALKDSAAANDGAAMARVAHALKSASFNIGAKPVAELCKRRLPQFPHCKYNRLRKNDWEK